MKRSSSKLIAKAGSVRNINKQGYKFRFTLHIESVDKIMGSSDVVVTWERRPKILSTTPARVDRTTRIAHFGGEKLEQEVTLFKKKKEGAEFDHKVYRLSVKNSSERGKPIGRIDIDFTDYVQIPTFSKRVSATLSSGGSIILRIESTYLGEAKPRGSSRGSGSVGSSTYADDMMSTSADDDHADIDDFEDMSVDDVPAPLPQPTPQPQLRKTPSTSSKARPPQNPSDDPPVVNGKFRRKGSASSPSRDPMKLETPSVPVQRGARMKSETDAVATTNAGAVSRTEFEKLKRENRLLRRKNDDLIQNNADLERRLGDAIRVDDGEDSVGQLLDENSELRSEVEELQARLDREPVYVDVVRELREAKMALAILTLDKEKLVHEVRRLKKM